MFTLEEINIAHKVVKSGSDFPVYIASLKEIGVKKYESFVVDGHVEYHGLNDFKISSESNYPAFEIAQTGDKVVFLRQLHVHQNGGTDYFTFCADMAKAGIEKWVMDMNDMTCIYYDKTGAVMLSEVIPD